MRLLAHAMGGEPETLAGLSGVGDLMLTCFSQLSRNNRFGRAIATGSSVDDACDELGEVVEGLPTALEVVHLAKKHGLGADRLPLFYAVGAILAGKATAKEALGKLMQIEVGREKFL